MKNLNVWKKSLVFLMITVVLLSAAGCGGKKAEEKKAEEKKTEVENAAPAVETAAEGVKIDYKTSELYTKEDMDAAIAKIMEEFGTWEGCEMHEISFTDDKTCQAGMELAAEQNSDQKYEECIVFISSFHSPVEGGGAWEPDYEYEGYNWYLARVKGDDWVLFDWGY